MAKFTCLCSSSQEKSSVGQLHGSNTERLPQEKCVEVAHAEKYLELVQENVVKHIQERYTEQAQERGVQPSEGRRAEERERIMEHEHVEGRCMKHVEEGVMDHPEDHPEENGMKPAEERIVEEICMEQANGRGTYMENIEESFPEQIQGICMEQLPQDSRQIRRYTFDVPPKITLQTERSILTLYMMYVWTCSFPCSCNSDVPEPAPMLPVSEPVPPASEPVPPASEPVPPASEPVPPASEPVPPTSEPALPVLKLEPPVSCVTVRDEAMHKEIMALLDQKVQERGGEFSWCTTLAACDINHMLGI